MLAPRTRGHFGIDCKPQGPAVNRRVPRALFRRQRGIYGELRALGVKRARGWDERSLVNAAASVQNKALSPLEYLIPVGGS